jgi:hypothetical protein
MQRLALTVAPIYEVNLFLLLFCLTILSIVQIISFEREGDQ